jgi:DNA-binding SARP family transcriptional activator
MTEIALNYLGNFEVLKDGKPLSLPPSRKTRALLAFLSLNPKRYRRDYLCELLWEIPDDPRGSLRWSLSKLRRLIDEPDRPRIVADRTFVEIDPADAAIDVTQLRTLVAERLATASTEELEAAAAEFTGNFLEGLDLPNFHDFHAWCIAERDQVARDQAALLKALVARHQEEPAKALPYARRLVGISPYDEETRASLIRLLVRLNHTDEAEQQYQLGLRMLKEVGVAPAGSIHAARRRPQPQPAAEAPPAVPPESDVVSIEQGSGLVGRDAEAASLAALFAEVRDKGKARFALIRGEPGIGKTRLVETLTALARGSGALVMSSSAYESESIRPFALWVDALRWFSPEASTEIFGDREASNRDRLFDRLSDFVNQQTKGQPLVLVFDDMHWCDDSSAAAIHYVARMNRDRPVFGLLTTREMELQDNVPAQQSIGGLRKDGILTDIELGPLNQSALVTLINDRAPGVRAEELSQRCGGNPLLAIELARAERAGDTSTSLGELVRERLARLGVEGMEIVQWAAILHPYISVEAIEALTDFAPEQIGEYLEAGVRQGILTVNNLGFSHNLLQQAVYTTLSPIRRQVMHRKVALWMEQGMAVDPGRAADLAHHASQSGDAGLAARAMVSAGRLALRFYAHDEALSLFKRGMQLVEELPDAERVCLSIDLHDIRLAASPLEDWDASAREYARLAEQALDLGELAHARLGYHMAAYVRWEHGQWADAREESLQSERVVRSGSDEDQIIGMAETAKCLVMIERDLSKADAMLMEAEALSARKGFRHFAVPAGLGMLRFHENRLDEATELLMESRALSKSAGARFDEFRANEYLFMIEFQRGNYEQARRFSGALQEIGDKLRVGSEAPFAHALAALVDYALTGNDRALDPALEELRVADAKHRLAYTLSRAAQLDCEHRHFDRAQARAEEALEYATLLNRASEMMLARAILACTAGERGDTKSVAEHEAVITSLQEAGVSAWASNYYQERKTAHGMS